MTSEPDDAGRDDAAIAPLPLGLVRPLHRSVGRRTTLRIGEVSRRATRFTHQVGAGMLGRPDASIGFAGGLPGVRIPDGAWATWRRADEAASGPVALDPAMASITARYAQRRSTRPVAEPARGLPAVLRRGARTDAGATAGPSGLARRSRPVETPVPRNDGHGLHVAQASERAKVNRATARRSAPDRATAAVGTTSSEARTRASRSAGSAAPTPAGASVPLGPAPTGGGAAAASAWAARLAAAFGGAGDAGGVASGAPPEAHEFVDAPAVDGRVRPAYGDRSARRSLDARADTSTANASGAPWRGVGALGAKRRRGEESQPAAAPADLRRVGDRRAAPSTRDKPEPRGRGADAPSPVRPVGAIGGSDGTASRRAETAPDPGPGRTPSSPAAAPRRGRGPIAPSERGAMAVARGQSRGSTAPPSSGEAAVAPQRPRAGTAPASPGDAAVARRRTRASASTADTPSPRTPASDRGAASVSATNATRATATSTTATSLAASAVARASIARSAGSTSRAPWATPDAATPGPPASALRLVLGAGELPRALGSTVAPTTVTGARGLAWAPARGLALLRAAAAEPALGAVALLDERRATTDARHRASTAVATGADGARHRDARRSGAHASEAERADRSALGVARRSTPVRRALHPARASTSIAIAARPAATVRLLARGVDTAPVVALRAPESWRRTEPAGASQLADTRAARAGQPSTAPGRGDAASAAAWAERLANAWGAAPAADPVAAGARAADRVELERPAAPRRAVRSEAVRPALSVHRAPVTVARLAASLPRATPMHGVGTAPSPLGGPIAPVRPMSAAARGTHEHARPRSGDDARPRRNVVGRAEFGRVVPSRRDRLVPAATRWPAPAGSVRRHDSGARSAATDPVGTRSAPAAATRNHAHERPTQAPVRPAPGVARRSSAATRRTPTADSRRAHTPWRPSAAPATDRGANTARATWSRPAHRRHEVAAHLARAAAARGQALPTSFVPLARLVGDAPVTVVHGDEARRALARVGRPAATVGSTILLDRAPDGAPATIEHLAHEVVHAAAHRGGRPSMPRLFDDPLRDGEERRAHAIGRLARSLGPEAVPAALAAAGRARGTVARTEARVAGELPVRLPVGDPAAALPGVDFGEPPASTGAGFPNVRRTPVPARAAGTALRRAPAASARKSAEKPAATAPSTHAEGATKSAPQPATHVDDATKSALQPATHADGATKSAPHAESATKSGASRTREPVTARLDRVDELVALIEARVLAELERRGGRHRGWL